MAEAQTHNDIRETVSSYRWARIVFAVAVAVMLLLPSVGMLWARSDDTLENRELASWPALFDEETGLDIGFMAKAGDYFDDHFAYRAQLIDAGARLYAGVFGVSTADTVVVGSDGWLYYAGTLGDYQDRTSLRKRQCLNIAHNVRLLQDECTAVGAGFAFTVAPDKNSLYDQAMPYYRPAVDSESMALLARQLERAGVNYVDAFELLGGYEERLYFLRDSHWTAKGALLVQEALARQAGFETLGVNPDDLQLADEYVGDLAKMLSPLSGQPETNWYADGVNAGESRYWELLEGGSVKSSSVETAQTAAADGALGERNGRLLMYNDSFGHNLIPYLASEFKAASFSKLIPYNALRVAEEAPDTVIVERAQRHVGYLAEEAPLMYAPVAQLPEAELGTAADASERAATPREGQPLDVAATINTSTNGPLLGVSGFLEGADASALGDEVSFVVRLWDDEGHAEAYVPFYLSDDETGNDLGFCAYVDAGQWQEGLAAVEVLAQEGDGRPYPVYFQAME